MPALAREVSGKMSESGNQSEIYLVLFLAAAQRAFCADAIFALPSGLILRFAGLSGAAGLLKEPLGRPRRLPVDVASEVPDRSLRAC